MNFPAVQQTFSVGKNFPSNSFARLRWSPSYRSKPKPHGNGASASGRSRLFVFGQRGVANAGGFGGFPSNPKNTAVDAGIIKWDPFFRWGNQT